MKVKVKFRDTEFGLFEPSFTVKGKDGQSYRGVYLEFTANDIPWRQLVLEEGIRGREYRETRDENPVFASLNDGVYWLIERILDSECEWDSECQCGEAVEIEYEGEDEMEEKVIKVPAGADKVTLNIERRNADPEGMTLRQALMATPSDKAVLVRVVDGPEVDMKRLAWEMFLPAIRSCAENNGSRRSRVAEFASCGLCDVPVLLDNRIVRRVDIQYNSHDTDCIVFEVENDA